MTLAVGWLHATPSGTWIRTLKLTFDVEPPRSTAGRVIVVILAIASAGPVHCTDGGSTVMFVILYGAGGRRVGASSIRVTCEIEVPRLASTWAVTVGGSHVIWGVVDSLLRSIERLLCLNSTTWPRLLVDPAAI